MVAAKSKPGPHVTTYAAVVGQVLARRRATLGLSQIDVASSLEAAQSVISRVESGVLPLTVETLARWSAALGAAPAEILTEAEVAKVALERQGVRVTYSRGPTHAASGGGTDGLALLGAAAVGALIGLALGQRE